MIKSNFFYRNRRKFVFLLVLVLFLGIGFGAYTSFRRKAVFAKMDENVPTTEYVAVTSGDISLSITGSGAIESSNTKNIASEVSAKVKQVNIKVGDKVSKGDVLFVLDSSDLDSQIRNKEKSITNYQKSINNYQKSINDYREDISNLNVVSNVNGYVQNLKVNVGDNVNKNDVIFEVIDSSVYQVEANLYYFDANPVNVGDKAQMLMSDTFSYIDGEVVYVSDYKEQRTGGGQMQKVIVEIQNPGYTLEGIAVRDIEVTTQNGSKVVAVKDGTIKIALKESTKFRSSSSGKVSTLNISNGSYITSGMLLMTLDNDDLGDKISDLNDSISEVRSSITDTYTDIADMKDDYTFYTITAPIDGVVTTLNVAEGDYVRSESTLATIINTDKMQFEISVDELDILKLKVGQKAKITIDAITETETNPVEGYVSEIGIVGTNMNSVTSYPVTITLDGREDIMMGMNCSVEIVVESSENVLIIPVEAVNSRRGKYYVTTEDGTEKEVTIGIYDEDYIEIKSGLTLGETVKLPTKVLATPTTEEKTAEGFGGGFMPGGMGGNMGGGSFPGGGGMPGGGSFGGSGRSSGGSRGGFSGR